MKADPTNLAEELGPTAQAEGFGCAPVENPKQDNVEELTSATEEPAADAPSELPFEDEICGASEVAEAATDGPLYTTWHAALAGRREAELTTGRDLVASVERRLDRAPSVVRFGRIGIPTAAIAFLASFAVHAGLIATAFWIVHARPWESPRQAAVAGDGEAGDGSAMRLLPGGPALPMPALPDLVEAPELPENLAHAPPPEPPAGIESPPPELVEVQPPAVDAPSPTTPVIGAGAADLFAHVPPSRRAPPTAAPPAPDAAGTSAAEPASAAASPDAIPSPAGVPGSNGTPSSPATADPGPASASPVVTEARAVAGGGKRGPRGADGLPTPDYPPVSQRLGEQGTVQLEVEVLPDGSLGRITVIADPGYPRLVKASIETFRSYRFEPKRVDGVPVSGTVTKKFTFRLD